MAQQPQACTRLRGPTGMPSLSMLLFVAAAGASGVNAWSPAFIHGPNLTDLGAPYCQYAIVGDCASSTGCALQSKINGDYVSAEVTRTGDGYGTLRARSASIGGWERYILIGDCTSALGCALRSTANGSYVSAELSRTGDGSGDHAGHAVGDEQAECRADAQGEDDVPQPRKPVG